MESQATIVLPPFPAPLAFVRLNPDNTVTVIAKHMEMGQGIHTGLATLVADELDAAREQIRIEAAPGQLGFGVIYGNALLGGIMGTGGQTSTQSSYLTYRNAGATARALLLAAAAQRTALPATEFRVAQGIVSHPTGASFTFGELAELAMSLPVPTDVTLKTPDQFTYIGKGFPRVDAEDKIHGRTIFTQDIKLPRMLTAIIARSPRIGGKVLSFDASETLAFPGVRQVVQVPTGIAVVADNFWAAYEGGLKLVIEWDFSEAATFSTADLDAQFTALLDESGLPAHNEGNVDTVKPALSITATYRVPYTVHKPFEGMDCVMQVTVEGIEMWGGSQIFAIDGAFVAQAAGVPFEKIKLNLLAAGGSFGRRSGPQAKHWLECLSIIQALGTNTPIKLMDSREDEIGGVGAYTRPGFHHWIEAGLENGKITVWKQRAVGQSILVKTAFKETLVIDGIDEMSVEGSKELPYTIPNRRLELHSPELPINVSWLRGGGVVHNLFAVESMMDELATLAKIDPLAFRLSHMPSSRERACLELVAEKAGWNTPLESRPGVRRGRGIAVGHSHRSYGASVVEVSVFPDNSWTIERVVSVMDCGIAINPDNIKSQMEGAIGFGISQARYNRTTFVNGEIKEKFYSDDHLTRMHTTPLIECHIMPSTEGPSGASETPVCSVPPAIANALAEATGIRLRSFPLILPGEPAEEHWDVPALLNTFVGAPLSSNR